MGDLVLCKVEVSNPTHSRGKIALTWKGPWVTDVVRDGTYQLATREGVSLLRT
ncbi:hypothetical protein B296_00023948 [Ensete ventricosum]|uniref:Uncharacterized protein n=1 Tax=Ensete ventricosum TaxID=4639 RepID=A0A427A6T8_ENSVE|nr:hypothetical protein B296_00023948 [Ensete ventricosum]